MGHPTLWFLRVRVFLRCVTLCGGCSTRPQRFGTTSGPSGPGGAVVMSTVAGASKLTPVGTQTSVPFPSSLNLRVTIISWFRGAPDDGQNRQFSTALTADSFKIGGPSRALISPGAPSESKSTLTRTTPSIRARRASAEYLGATNLHKHIALSVSAKVPLDMQMKNRIPMLFLAFISICLTCTSFATRSEK